MSKSNFPITPAIRFLREKNINFMPHLYPYKEHGGTAHSADCLNIDEHIVIKTIVLQNENKQGLICLMHGNKQISTRNLARTLGMKHIEPATPQQANKWTGYLVGGTSPFGCKTALSVYAQTTIQNLPEIYINGGKRGFLISITAQDLNHLNVQWVDVAA
ncbi:aminoacyl-tRNA deacylase [Neisseriaceae bacterium B1]